MRPSGGKEQALAWVTSPHTCQFSTSTRPQRAPEVLAGTAASRPPTPGLRKQTPPPGSDQSYWRHPGCLRQAIAQPSAVVTRDRMASPGNLQPLAFVTSPCSRQTRACRATGVMGACTVAGVEGGTAPARATVAACSTSATASAYRAPRQRQPADDAKTPPPRREAGGKALWPERGGEHAPAPSARRLASAERTREDRCVPPADVTPRSTGGPKGTGWQRRSNRGGRTPAQHCQRERSRAEGAAASSGECRGRPLGVPPCRASCGPCPPAPARIRRLCTVVGSPQRYVGEPQLMPTPGAVQWRASSTHAAANHKVVSTTARLASSTAHRPRATADRPVRQSQHRKSRQRRSVREIQSRCVHWILPPACPPTRPPTHPPASPLDYPPAHQPARLPTRPPGCRRVPRPSRVRRAGGKRRKKRGGGCGPVAHAHIGHGGGATPWIGMPRRRPFVSGGGSSGGDDGG